MQQSIALGTYVVTGTSGRVALSQTNSQTALSLPVLYIASPPTDGISAFLAGQDSTAMFGLAEFQPAQTYTTSALAGNYFFGTEDSRSNAVTNTVGTLSVIDQVRACLWHGRPQRPSRPDRRPNFIRHLIHNKLHRAEWHRLYFLP